MEKNKKINTSSIIILVFIGAVILGVAGYMVFQYIGGGSDDATDPTESTVPLTEENLIGIWTRETDTYTDQLTFRYDQNLSFERFDNSTENALISSLDDSYQIDGDTLTLSVGTLLENINETYTVILSENTMILTASNETSYFAGVYQRKGGADDLTDITEPTTEETESITEPTTEAPTEPVAVWKEPYINYISNLGSAFSYGLIYVDDDDIPELIAVAPTSLGGYEIATFDQEKVVSEHLSAYSVYYIEKSGLILNSGGRNGYYFDRIYQIANGSIQFIHDGYNGPYTDYSLDGDNSNAFDKYGLLGSEPHFDEAGNMMNQYVWDAQSVSMAQYDLAVNGVFNKNLGIDVESNLLGYDAIIAQLQSMN